MKFIKDLKKLSKKDISLAGGKGANLGEMLKIGIPVPPGFVVLASAFERFLEETDINVEIKAVLDRINIEDIESVEESSEILRDLILEAKMPKNIEKEILDAFNKLKAKYVAVRSSATAEDSKIDSWAGELETYLNTTKENLIENVKKCWVSLYTPRALFYRVKRGLKRKKVSVAVVVQKMIQSEVSGVCFTVHPVTKDRNQMIIEAAFGLGAILVSGQITPDTYVIEKDSLNILDININPQEKMILRAKEGNTTVVVPKNKRNKQKLSEKQIKELAKLCIKIENHYKDPQDIEWAQENGKLYIVQSRPITTLSNNNTKESINSNSKIYEKLFSRDFCLASVGAWIRGESTNPKGWTDKKQPFLPYLITERSDDTVHFYYDLQGVEWVQDLLVQLAHEDKNFIKKIEQTVLEKLKYIRPIYEKEKILNISELKRFIRELEDGYPWFEAMWWFCQMDAAKLVGLDLKNIQKVRALTDKLCNGSDTVIRKSLIKIYPQLGDLTVVLTTQEITFEKIPPKIELKKRYERYFFGNNQLFVGKTHSQIEKKFGIKFQVEVIDKTRQLKGDIAQKGIVRGYVRRVMGHKQINQIKKGEILVSPMTMPDFLPAMKKAAAFVTDEGGVVCHAAIVARELKKPCIVGTKFATQILKDGDYIEVNANKGIINILKD